MGLLKKVFKPVRKVLDKIIPNEIKPALPYIAAFTPFMAPTTGFFSTMGGRALLAGGANIGAQLAQEGTTEDDLNLLSAGIAAATGALSAPGAGDKLAGMTTKGQLAEQGIIGSQARMELANRSLLQKGVDLGLTGASKAANFLSAERGSGGVGDILRPGGTQLGFNTASATALGVPLAQGTGDAMYTDAVLAQKQQIIDDALAAAELLEDSGARAQAIRNAMSAYQFFTEEEIEDTISSAGYRAGGRVGFKNAGLAGLAPPKMDAESSFEIDSKPIIIKFYSKEDSGRRNEAFYEVMDPITGTKSNISQDDYIAKYGEPKAKGGRVGFRFGGIDAAIDSVEDEDIKESVKMVADMPDMDLMDLIEEFEITFKRKPMNMEELKQFYRENYEMESPVRMREKIKEKVTVEAKDGGLMNLGGKEMDLRKGGFVPIGKKERADDVPARLSKNEFVMTADAVRAAGGGSVNKGAKRMYNLMNTLEARA